MAHQTGSCLFLDSARCHSTALVNDKLTEMNIARAIIPPLMTNLVQPADVAWFSSIKIAYHQKWNHWFRFGIFKAKYSPKIDTLTISSLKFNKDMRTKTSIFMANRNLPATSSAFNGSRIFGRTLIHLSSEIRSTNAALHQ